VLWLAGLGVSVWFNPPRQPQDNGVVERGNGTGQCWAEVRKCRTAAEVQDKISFADRIQRDILYSIEGRSRRAAFPGLAHSGRRYDRGWEEQQWDLSKAEALLEGHLARRKVSSQGHVSVYDRDVYVGKRHAGVRACVQYDRGSKVWVVSREEDGHVLRCVGAPEITRDRIIALTMCIKA
jgi:hypothetical protein